jgi:hypothetical protein
MLRAGPGQPARVTSSFRRALWSGPRFPTCAKGQESVLGTLHERDDDCVAVEKELPDGASAGIANHEPDDLRWGASEEAELAEVIVLRNQHEPMLRRIVPELVIGSATETDLVDMDCAWESTCESCDEPMTEVLVEEKPHAADPEASLRSRAAAKARAALRWSGLRTGNSSSNWASLIPPAMYSNTSYTVIRVPLKHGFPDRTPGRISMKSSKRMPPR